MRALAITGMETASTMPSIMSGSLMRETPPSARMSAGTRSSAMTATAPASSAILACSGVTTSMMTPPFSVSAMPRLTRAVPTSASVFWVSDTVTGSICWSSREGFLTWSILRRDRPHSAVANHTPEWRDGSAERVFDVPVLRPGQAVVEAQQHGDGQGPGGDGIAHKVGVDLTCQGDAPVRGLQVVGSGMAVSEFPKRPGEVVLGVFTQLALPTGLGGD